MSNDNRKWEKEEVTQDLYIQLDHYCKQIILKEICNQDYLITSLHTDQLHLKLEVSIYKTNIKMTKHNILFGFFGHI